MDMDVIKRYFDIDTKKIIENESLQRIRNWRIIKSEFPIFVLSMQHPLSNKEYYLRFLCDEFPISVQVVNSVDFSPLPHSEWPQGNYFINGHSKTQGPFLCAPGIREYHTHNSHEAETQWDFTSPSFKLPSVIDTVYSHFLRTNS